MIISGYGLELILPFVSIVSLAMEIGDSVLLVYFSLSGLVLLNLLLKLLCKSFICICYCWIFNIYW